MQKKTFIFVALIIALAIIAVLLAYDPTRPIVFGVALTLWAAFLSGVNSITASVWWQLYGIYIVAASCLTVGIFLTAMYYRGKIAIWRWGAQKASDMVSQRQPAPAPSPTPLATTPTPTVMVEQKKTEEAEA